MNNTPISRRMDDLGRIVIPKEIRTQLNLRAGDPLEISLTPNNEIQMKKMKEPDFTIVKTDFGEEMVVNKNGDVVIPPKAKITPQDIASLVGIEIKAE